MYTYPKFLMRALPLTKMKQHDAAGGCIRPA